MFARFTDMVKKLTRIISAHDIWVYMSGWQKIKFLFSSTVINSIEANRELKRLVKWQA